MASILVLESAELAGEVNHECTQSPPPSRRRPFHIPAACAQGDGDSTVNVDAVLERVNSRLDYVKVKKLKFR